MAIVDGSLQLGYKNTAWFTANPTLILKQGQIVALEQTGTYKLGDGVTQLSALTFLGGGDTVDVNTIGAAINGATSATPNDTDLVMSVDTSVAKKNTWTQIKAFLKTYFDTVYATITDLTGYVKKGTLTTNTIPKATAGDTIVDSQMTDDGTSVVIGDGTLFKRLSIPNAGSRIIVGVGSGLEPDTYNLYFKTDNTVINYPFGIKDKNNLNLITTDKNGYTTLGKEQNYAIPWDAVLQILGGNTSSDKLLSIKNNITNSDILLVKGDGSINLPLLTASQIVETDASKNLISVAKGTAYNKDFGTTAGTVTEGGTSLLIANNLSDLNNFITARTTNLRMWDLFLTAGNQTTTSNVAANITELVTPTLTANKRYKISGQILITCSGTGGVKFQATVPAGATLSMGFTGNTNTQTAFGQYGVAASATLMSPALCTTAAIGTYATVIGEVSIGANAGTIQFGFASGTNTQTSTIFQLGTHLTITQIN